MKSLFKKIIVAILTSQAKAALACHKPKIIAVTGSVGKTSTKDAIHAVVASRAVARKSNKSFNSDVGVPLTILAQPNGWSNPFAWVKILLAGARVKNMAPGTYPEWLVLEVGADQPGDIRRLVPWLHPDVVVVTMEGDATPVHIGFFENKKALVDEDHAIVAAMKGAKSVKNAKGAQSEQGVRSALIVNADDADSMRASNLASGPVWSIGIEQPAAVRATHYEIAYETAVLPSGDAYERPVGIRFRIEHGGVSVPMERLGVIGMHHMYPSLAAVAVALSQDWNMVAAAEALRQLESTPGRMRVLAGIKGSTIIDDSYNASPIAVKAAMKALLEVKVGDGRRIAVLGDMRELGVHSENAHGEIGKMIAGLHKEGKIHIFAAVGPEARLMHAAAERVGMPASALLYFPHATACATWLDSVLNVGDVVLIKGSQGVRCERIVKAVMADPRDAEHLLVRQDAVWQGME